MTEHGRATVARERTNFQIGKNSIERLDDRIIINVEDICSPIPSRISGRIVIKPEWINNNAFEIDAAGRHRWRPIAPSASIEVKFEHPNIEWRGNGYFDHNNGDEPLEGGFHFWDWSRFQLTNGDVAVLYNTTMRNGAKRSLAARFLSNGEVSEFESPPVSTLQPTPIWRIDRRTRCEGAEHATLIKTLEDTPFYSRSIIESQIFGERAVGMHETLNGPRLRSPIVRGLLPFRMPRVS